MVSLYISSDNGDRAGLWGIGFWLNSDMVDSLKRFQCIYSPWKLQILCTQARLQPETCRWSNNLFLSTNISEQLGLIKDFTTRTPISFWCNEIRIIICCDNTILYYLFYLYFKLVLSHLTLKKRWSCGCPHSDSCPFKVEFRLNQHVTTTKGHFAFLCML
jgi:hypothetical protein